MGSVVCKPADAWWLAHAGCAVWAWHPWCRDLKKLTSECMLQPQDAYGLEKLASRGAVPCTTSKDFGIECRIARFHNIYGPYGTWKGGREKAPAAFCRKVRSAVCRSSVNCLHKQHNVCFARIGRHACSHPADAYGHLAPSSSRELMSEHAPRC